MGIQSSGLPTVSNTYSSLISNITINNVTIGHGGVIKDGTVEVGISSTRQISIAEVSALQNGSFQFGIGEISTNQESILQRGAIQVSPTEVRTTKISCTKIRTQMSITEIRQADISINHLSSLEVSPFQTSTREVSFPQISTIQVSSSQINTTQVGSTQLSISQINPGKIPLPSSISSQQLFSIHILTSESITTINNSAITLWNTLFDPTFDITFQIEDLPTGQLAEAQITNYDSLGRPNGGTILIDCTSLVLVDNARGKSALLLAENQNCGIEPKDCHEGTGSAAPVAENEKSLNSAIADPKIELSRPSAELMTENLVSGDEDRVDHEGTGSAAPVSLNQSEIFEWLDRANLGECPPLWVIQYLLDSKYYASMRATISKFEKQWNLSVVNYQVQKSSEATAEDTAMRSQARLLRMEKLRMASLVRENPGFDFLQQCWNDDQALKIVIKKLLAKFPQWGIACVDGVLGKWDK